MKRLLLLFILLASPVSAQVVITPGGGSGGAGGGGAAVSEVNAGNSGTAATIDWSAAAQQRLTLTGSPTLTFSNPSDGASYRLVLIQNATGGFTVTWPATVRWEGGVAPTLVTTANNVTFCSFVRTAAGAGGYLGFCTGTAIALP
jgi:hypothetical protein